MDTEQEQPAEQQQKFAPAPTPSKAPVATDLSAEIAATIEKEPGDRVRVTWVAGNCYRCNWWAPGSTAGYDNPGMYGLVVTTHQVRKSQFLVVTKTGDRLQIQRHARSGK